MINISKHTDRLNPDFYKKQPVFIAEIIDKKLENEAINIA